MTLIQDHLISRLRAFAAGHGLQTLPERNIDYGLQIIVTDGSCEVPLNIYTTGKLVVGGKASPLRSQLQEWAASQGAGGPAKPGRVLAAHIGVDESGKGDVFGPLVVAGAVVQPEQSSLLQSQEIRDSKTLTSSRIHEVAAWLENRCPLEVLVLAPLEFNQRYVEMGNLDLLLGWGHAQVIQRLYARTGVTTALSDQFSHKRPIQQALAAANCPVVLEERPHAESDLAVAAASIVARAAFERSFGELRRKSGLDLPFGASDPRIPDVLQAIFERWGEEGLRRSTKLNFKPVKAVLEARKNK